jgi:hypothetical protein
MRRLGRGTKPNKAFKMPMGLPWLGPGHACFERIAAARACEGHAD